MRKNKIIILINIILIIAVFFIIRGYINVKPVLSYFDFSSYFSGNPPSPVEKIKNVLKSDKTKQVKKSKKIKNTQKMKNRQKESTVFNRENFLRDMYALQGNSIGENIFYFFEQLDAYYAESDIKQSLDKTTKSVFSQLSEDIQNLHNSMYKRLSAE